MAQVEPHPLPERALLNVHARAGAYTDCYTTEVAGTVACARYVEAFYTTPLFKLERLILKLVAAKPSTDVQAREVAGASIGEFAAWRVEAREDDQLLMCDMHGNTRSWFMVEPVNDGGRSRTRLYFGSAVTKTAMDRPIFRCLIGFHVLYSKALLLSARRRIQSRGE